MKLFIQVRDFRGASLRRTKSAFTLVEILVSMALFSLLLGGIVYGNVFGLKMCEITKSKLVRSAEARNAIGQLADEIRCGKTAWIGDVDAGGTFQGIINGQPQSGSALMICPTTNRANYIVYFRNSDGTFRRVTSANTTPTAIAASVTNSVIFRAQDHRGNVLTNSQNNRVMHVKLEFFQARGLVPDAEYFRLETAVTRRAID